MALFSDSEGGIKSFFSSAQAKWGITGLVFACLIFFLLKACSPHDLFERDYIVGQDNRWSGVVLQGREKNLTAFNSDLLAKVGQLEKIQLHLVSGHMEDLTKDIDNGKIEAILTSQKPTFYTSRLYVFSNPYYLTGPVLILPNTAPLEGWNDMAQKIIGVQSNSPSIIELEKDPKVKLKLYDDILTALADLSKRRIDGAIFPAIPAYVYVSTFYSNELRVATLPLNEEGIRLMALKNKAGQELIAAFNDALKQMREDGSYEKLLDRWGLVNVQKFIP